MARTISLSYAVQGVPECRECSCGAHPGAHPAHGTPTAAELVDLDGSDPGSFAGVDAAHASTSRALVAQEADDFEDLPYLGKLLAAVFVELVDRVRVLQGEPHAVNNPLASVTLSTMAGRGFRPGPQIARAIAAHSSAPKRYKEKARFRRAFSVRCWSSVKRDDPYCSS